jgi:hypothetical protein
VKEENFQYVRISLILTSMCFAPEYGRAIIVSSVMIRVAAVVTNRTPEFGLV